MAELVRRDLWANMDSISVALGPEPTDTTNCQHDICRITRKQSDRPECSADTPAFTPEDDAFFMEAIAALAEVDNCR